MSDLGNDIGQITKGLRDSAQDTYEIWMRQPLRRCEYGAPEVTDIQETYLALGILLREMDKLKRREAA